MMTGPGGAALCQIGRLFEGDSVVGLDEVQLLERFVARRDEPAFAALVARHGPMVLAVCRRLLADPLDVEDAFQATFLVLVHRAGSIRDRDRLAPWLFGVARRVANRARLDASRRKARERPGAEEAAQAPGVDEHRIELGRALVEEIERLPASLRLPVVFCCVEGLTYEEAAERLGSTSPAIRGRLSRARERLRTRLTRRGFAPSAGAVAAMLSAEAASAAVPATLMTSTIRVVIRFTAGRAATAGTVPVAVVALAEGVIHTMMIPKWKVAAMALTAFGVVGSGVGVLGQQPAAEPAPARQNPPEPAPARQNPPEPAPARQNPPDPVPARQNSPDRLDSVEQKLDRLIRVLEGSNRPAAGMMPGPGVMPRPTYGMGGRSTTRAPERKDQEKEAANTSARLDAIEQRLERLEARMADVDRRFGPLPSSAAGLPSLPDRRLGPLPSSGEGLPPPPDRGRSPFDLDAPGQDPNPPIADPNGPRRSSRAPRG